MFNNYFQKEDCNITYGEFKRAVLTALPDTKDMSFNEVFNTIDSNLKPLVDSFNSLIEISNHNLYIFSPALGENHMERFGTILLYFDAPIRYKVIFEDNIPDDFLMCELDEILTCRYAKNQIDLINQQNKELREQLETNKQKLQEYNRLANMYHDI